MARCPAGISWMHGSGELGMGIITNEKLLDAKNYNSGAHCTFITATVFDFAD